VSEGCDVIVSECGDAMSNANDLSTLMIVLAMFEGLP
jgi:hypothetical protein